MDAPELEGLAAAVAASQLDPNTFDEMPRGPACAIEGCVALPVPDSPLCLIHSNITRREDDSVAIHCDACGTLIRIGQRWLVRAEGAFHLNPFCLNLAPELRTPWKGKPRAGA